MLKCIKTFKKNRNCDITMPWYIIYCSIDPNNQETGNKCNSVFISKEQLNLWIAERDKILKNNMWI